MAAGNWLENLLDVVAGQNIPGELPTTVGVCGGNIADLEYVSQLPLDNVFVHVESVFAIQPEPVATDYFRLAFTPTLEHSLDAGVVIEITMDDDQSIAERREDSQVSGSHPGDGGSHHRRCGSG